MKHYLFRITIKQIKRNIKYLRKSYGKIKVERICCNRNNCNIQDNVTAKEK